MDKTGVIYILTNPSFPEYVKIGYADDIDKRLQQLNRSECIPFAFRVYATYEVNSRLSDLKIHSIIDKLNPNLRSIENFNGKQRVREFYAHVAGGRLFHPGGHRRDSRLCGQAETDRYGRGPEAGRGNRPGDRRRAQRAPVALPLFYV